MSTKLDSNQNPVGMDLGTLQAARFLSRPNRFRAEILIEGQASSAHLANPGRLRELLIPGRTVWVRRVDQPHRKTSYDLVLAQYGETLVSVNSHIPNALLARALRGGHLPWVEPGTSVRPEARLGKSRIDFHLQSQEGQTWWLEAKSVTLVEGGIARFPDAPTLRGRRHMRELRAAAQQGAQALVVFVVQRNDAECFVPNDATDPDFGQELRDAAEAGVQVRALCCRVTRSRISLDHDIPAFLDGQQGHGYNPCDSPD